MLPISRLENVFTGSKEIFSNCKKQKLSRGGLRVIGKLRENSIQEYLKEKENSKRGIGSSDINYVCDTIMFD